jgi:hypothetical protein
MICHAFESRPGLGLFYDFVQGHRVFDGRERGLQVSGNGRKALDQLIRGMIATETSPGVLVFSVAMRIRLKITAVYCAMSAYPDGAPP